MRPSGRAADELRTVSLETDVNKHAEGSCLARFGDTHVLCTVSIEDSVPYFMRNSGRGWVTAEYGMLPRSTAKRTAREAARGRQSGRTQEIQRLIGRSLRAVTDLSGFGERQIKIDCDVIQADGGTRSSRLAVHKTWVSPNRTRQEPSAYLAKPGSRLTARISSGRRPDGRMAALLRASRRPAPICRGF